MPIALENLADVFLACAPLLPLGFDKATGRTLTSGVEMSARGVQRIVSNAEYLNLLASTLVTTGVLLVTVDRQLRSLADFVRIAGVVIGILLAVYLYNIGTRAYWHLRPAIRRAMAFLPAVLIICKLFLPAAGNQPALVPQQTPSPTTLVPHAP